MGIVKKDKLLSVLILVCCFLVASVMLSMCNAYAQLPCEREAVRAERVCKKYGEDSVTCANARRTYDRCMESQDPLEGIC